ncbi:polysaccharide deacetylase family protein [Sulfuricurvum sp.]|uniref:polysaccharide deacetylase family protein n=1 Tax=Sulfuricurvum sp. TaxID=2025608 RepID=UPI002601960F|nr:polysaccharide deacetylase family protein [Sulfuricurvum sp.]MDD2266277.1 polysaccharide deacetylase family protein [Sulfuricurvum sp.]MDD2783325.1 polysaccharide deacetylase family protein [Sulfuricurvum sp.]
MTKLFLILTFLFHTALFADTDIIYDIRGYSPQLDANMTQFLDKWRINTVTPVQAGHYKNVIVNANTSRKNVTLTFDDAPDENNTYKLLDILKSHHVKAAFFMIGGTMVDSNITVVKRANDEGHLVLNHTFNHPRLTDLDENNITYQLGLAAARIETITGHYPILYRPPYGSINARVLNTVNDQGMTTVLWSLDSLDWTLKDPNAVVENVADNVRNGDIILMHRNPTSVAALPGVIEKLMEMGYTFLRLDELLGIKPYR